MNPRWCSMNQNKKAWLYLAIAILSFSSYEVVSKTVTAYIHPTQLTFIRFLTGSLCLLPFALRDLKRGIRLTGKDIIKMFCLGSLNVVVSMNLIQMGYQYTNANLSAVIISSNPIFIAFLSTFLLNERLERKKLIGLLIGICGVAVAVGGTGALIGTHMLWGIGLQIIGMLCFSLFTVLGKKSSLKMGSCVMTTFTGLLGSIALLPFLLIQGTLPWDFELRAIPFQMLYICVFNTGIAFYLYFRALEALDTGTGSMSFFAKPLLAGVWAALFLGETMTWQLFMGILFVAAGIYLAMLSTPQKTAPTDNDSF